MTEVVTDSVETTHKQAKQLLESLSIKESQAVVIGLTGPLGAGKTEFIRGFLRAAGVTDPVTSPTYTIETLYQLPDSQFERAYHIDAYRLDGKQDLLDIEFADRLRDNESVVIIEWAKRVQEVLPEDTIWVAITLENDQRVITLNK